jgi:hypothetical protein
MCIKEGCAKCFQRDLEGLLYEVPKAARIHKVLSQDPKVKLCFLVALSGKRMQYEGKISMSSYIRTFLFRELWRRRRHLASPVALHELSGR